MPGSDLLNLIENAKVISSKMLLSDQSLDEENRYRALYAAQKLVRVLEKPEEVVMHYAWEVRTDV